MCSNFVKLLNIEIKLKLLHNKEKLQVNNNGRDAKIGN